MKKIILIDGNSLVYRAFYALPTTIATSSGVVTNAVYGFMAMLLRLIKDEKPDCLAVAFDKGIVTFRHEIFIEYKAQRAETPDELRHQFGLVKDVLESLDIPIYEMEGYEADDILATMAKKSAEEDMDVRVVTGDKDAFQLINDNIKIMTTRKGITDIVTYTKEKVLERYGLPPDKMLDMVGLKGDPSDNIPGVPGIGEKTASKLIQEFGSIENLMEHREEIKGPKLKQSLYDFEQQARDSKKLATLHYDVPVGFDWKKCFVSVNLEKARNKFRELEFNTLIKRLEEYSGAGGLAETKDIEGPPKFGYKELTNDNIQEILSLKEMVVHVWRPDTENNTLFPNENILLIGTGRTIYKCKTEYFSKIKPVLEDSSAKKTALYFKPVLHDLLKHQIELKGMEFDCAVAAYLLNPGKEIFFEELVSKYLGIVYPELPPDAGSDYFSLKDVEIALLLKGALEKDLKENSLTKIFSEIEIPLIPVLVKMEYFGIGIDTGLMKSYSEELKSFVDKLEVDIYRHAGTEFNINSPQQLSEILFEKLLLKPIKKIKTGFSTDSSVLARLINAHPIITEIINYRELSKLKSTYVDALPELVKEDGRLHTTFNQTVTATGRLSSSNPNLQNIPVRTDFGSQIRKAFIPLKEDEELLIADYDQIELRILAHLSSDAKLVTAFDAAEDIHKATAKEVFLPAQAGIKEVTADMRQAAKAVNFGIVYGIGSRGLAEQLNITQMEAKIYIEKYFNKYPSVRQFLDSIVEEATNKGFVETMFGRKRWLPELKSADIRIRNFGKRTAVNTVMQGSAADIIKKAMINLDRELDAKGLRSHLVLQVHDELILQVPPEEKEAVSALLKEVMVNVVKMKPMLKVSMSGGKNWLEAKG